MESVSNINRYSVLRYILLWFLAASITPRISAQETGTGSNIVSRAILSSNQSKVFEQHVYDNGLGDVVQEVQAWPGSSLQDLVVHHEYDKYRRKTKSWLPVTSSSNEGLLSRNMIANMAQTQYSDPAPFTSTDYDSFFPSQPSALYKAGAQWQNNNKKVSVAYSKYVGCTMHSYREGYLFITVPEAKFICTRTTDEEGCWNAEYTDMNGRVMIRETSQGKTFYMYDFWGNITYVIPPMLADYLISHYGYDSEDFPDTDEMIQKYGYIYRYDKQGHCIYKKLPGCDPIYYVYDKTGTCILSQDGEQRLSGVWAYTIPDNFGRPCIKGICHTNLNYTSEPLHSFYVRAVYDQATTANGGYTIYGLTYDWQTLYAATYYDNYSFIGHHGVPSSMNASSVSGFPIDTSIRLGMQTGSAVAVIRNGNITGYTYSALYYDSHYNLSQVKTTTHLGDLETTCTTYSYTGKPNSIRFQHTSSTTGTLIENHAYAYDAADRVSSNTLSVSNGTGTPSQYITFRYLYDALGRLSEIVRPSTASTNQNISYTYDMHGWMTSITTNSFREELFYANGPGAHYYNGNISSVRWRNNGYDNKRGYRFTYDNAGRLTTSEYGEGDAISSSLKFREHMEYDAHGNITRIIRRGKTSASGYGNMDNLTLSYDGNQLTNVSESSIDYNVAGSFEYKRLNGSQYIYNRNGSLVADRSRGIAYIKYDFNNNPETIYFTNGNMTRYTYSGAGEKLRVEHYVAQPNVTWAFGVLPNISQNQATFTDCTDYLLGGNLIKEQGIIKKLLFDGGYFNATAIAQNAYGFTPYYYNKDHLGNNREVTLGNGDIRQVTNYYPFGAPYADPLAVSGATIQQYKYNGKELDMMHGLNTYDYGARQYNPILGRWDRMDPLCEKYYDKSPYVYCANNPVKFIDPDGKFIANAVGALVGAGEEYANQVLSNFVKGGFSTTIFTDVDLFDISVATVEGAITCGGSAMRRTAIKGASTIATNALDIKTDGKVDFRGIDKIATGSLTDVITDKLKLPSKNKQYIPTKSRQVIRADGRKNYKKTGKKEDPKETIKKGKEKNKEITKTNDVINDAKSNWLGNSLNGIVHGFIDKFYRSN